MVPFRRNQVGPITRNPATGKQRLLVKPHMLKGAKVIWPDADLNPRVAAQRRARGFAKMIKASAKLGLYAAEDAELRAALLKGEKRNRTTKGVRSRNLEPKGKRKSEKS
jgi:hypothetical protein